LPFSSGYASPIQSAFYLARVPRTDPLGLQAASSAGESDAARASRIDVRYDTRPPHQVVANHALEFGQRRTSRAV
jgi:hypothetical protein